MLISDWLSISTNSLLVDINSQFDIGDHELMLRVVIFYENGSYATRFEKAF